MYFSANKVGAYFRTLSDDEEVTIVSESNIAYIELTMVENGKNFNVYLMEVSWEKL